MIKNIKTFLKYIPWIFLIIGVCSGLYAIFYGIHLKSLVKNQDMARYWGEDYRQVSVFSRGNNGEYIDANISLGEADILTIREYLQNVYDQQSIEYKGRGLKSDGTPDGWEDSFVTYKTIQLDNLEIDLFGVGGNYNAFSDAQILDGAFLTEEVVNPNLVVINERLSWKMFSSFNVSGNEIKINDTKYTIAGVIRDDKDTKLEEYTGGNNFRVYMYMDMYKKATGISNPAILCYEAFLPEFTKGVSITDIKNALPVYNENNGNYYIISNTGRFNVSNLWKSNVPVGSKDYRLKDYNLPYWEQMALVVEKRLFIDVIIGLSGIVISLFSGIYIVKMKRIDSFNNLNEIE